MRLDGETAVKSILDEVDREDTSREELIRNNYDLFIDRYEDDVVHLITLSGCKGHSGTPQTTRSVCPSMTAGAALGEGIGRPIASVTPLDCKNCAHFGSMNRP